MVSFRAFLFVMAASRPFEGDFNADPAGVHLFDCNSENVFSAFPDKKSQPRPHPTKMSAYKVTVQVLKVLFIIATIVVWGILLRQLLVEKEAPPRTVSELKVTPTYLPVSQEIANREIEQIIKESNYCTGIDWIAYKDEECFKLIKKWATRDDAASICRLERLSTDSEDPHLASIKDAEEQAFLSKLLFTDSELNVWIGARRNVSDGPFSWEDDSPVTYNNWAHSASAVDLSAEKNCVELHKMVVGKESLDGKWRPASCKQANYFVCQKAQRWPLKKLQRSFLETRREFSTIVENTRIAMREFYGEKEAKLFPIGFIYVQLPHQSSPLELWPQLSWLVVSGNFSGTFLRVEGDAAAPFGQIQEENTSGQLQSVAYIRGDGIDGKVDLGKGKCSKVRTGAIYSYREDFRSLQFCTRDGEVRPKNMAVKIWKRVE